MIAGAVLLSSRKVLVLDIVVENIDLRIKKHKKHVFI